jgi:ABC-2 type transport system permease protein
MIERFYTLAFNTFIETVRQPIYAVIVVATAILMIFNVSLAAFTLSDDDKLLLDLGLSTLLLSGLFLSVFSATGVLTREIENKTVMTVVSKPISRPTFLLGKYVGLLAALAVAYYVSFLIFVLAQRHGVLQRSSDPWDAPVLVFGFGGALLAFVIAGFCDYFYRVHYSTTAIGLAAVFLTFAVLLAAILDEHWAVIEFGSNLVSGQVVVAAYLIFLVSVIIAAVALAASTRFGQLVTLVICTAVLGLGIVSDYAFGQHEAGNKFAWFAYRVVPNVGPFWIIDGLTSGSEETAAPASYVLLATGYAVVMTVGVLCIGVALFQKREVG